MKVIRNQHQILLLCDSWYPKAEVADLVNQFENLDLICNVRVDTVLFDLPPTRTRKHGRPKKHGDRLDLDQIPLSKPKTGKGSRRLFLCTKNPEEISFDLERCADDTIHQYSQENRLYLPLAWYGLRWNMEVSYYEEFWSLEEYRIRSKQGVERLVNLISLSYSAMTLLSYSDETFSGYQSASTQKMKYEMNQQIQATIILCSFGKFLETVKNSTALIKIVEDYILSGFKKVQKL